MHLLMQHGADPNIRDGQGFNTLHLVTHSSAVMPLLYMVRPRRGEAELTCSYNNLWP